MKKQAEYNEQDIGNGLTNKSYLYITIIDGYNENKNKIKSKYCFRLLEIYQNKDIKYYIKKWKKNILNRKKEEKTRNDSNNISNQFSSKTSNNQNLKPNKKYLDKDKYIRRERYKEISI